MDYVVYFTTTIIHYSFNGFAANILGVGSGQVLGTSTGKLIKTGASFVPWLIIGALLIAGSGFYLYRKFRTSKKS